MGYINENGEAIAGDGVKVLLGNQVKSLSKNEATYYADALLATLERTRGNRRIARELHATLTHLSHLA